LRIAAGPWIVPARSRHGDRGHALMREMDGARVGGPDAGALYWIRDALRGRRLLQEPQQPGMRDVTGDPSMSLPAPAQARDGRLVFVLGEGHSHGHTVPREMIAASGASRNAATRCLSAHLLLHREGADQSTG